jgi:hypothetical protein
MAETWLGRQPNLPEESWFDMFYTKKSLENENKLQALFAL